MGLELLFSFEHHAGVRHSESPVISWGQALGDMQSPVLFFFCLNFKIASHFPAGKSLFSHQHLENIKFEFFLGGGGGEGIIYRHSPPFNLKREISFYKIKAVFSLFLFKRDIWAASLILVATKELFGSLMLWGNTWLFSFFLATKTYRCNLCLSRKKMEIKIISSNLV